MVDAHMETNAASSMIGISCILRAAKARESPKEKEKEKEKERGRAKAKLVVLNLNNPEKDVLASEKINDAIGQEPPVDYVEV